MKLTQEIQDLFETIRLKLGGGIRSVEVTDEAMCACLELAMRRYNEYTLNFIIDGNWSNFYGKQMTNSDLAFAFSVRTLDMSRDYSDYFSHLVGLQQHGTKWELKKDFFQIVPGQQVYVVPAGRQINKVLHFTNSTTDAALLATYYGGAYGFGGGAYAQMGGAAAGAFAGLLGWSLTPMFGAAAMSVSSFLVVVNALRLNLYNPTKTAKNVNQDCQNTDFEAKTTKSEELAVKNTNGIESLEVSVSLTSENKIEGAKKCEFTAEKENQTTAAVLDVKAENERKNEMNITIKINGMMCPHCSGRVKKLLEESPLVVAADVSHERGDAVVVLAKAEDETTVLTLKEIINGAGYETP